VSNSDHLLEEKCPFYFSARLVFGTKLNPQVYYLYVFHQI